VVKRLILDKAFPARRVDQMLVAVARKEDLAKPIGITDWGENRSPPVQIIEFEPVISGIAVWQNPQAVSIESYAPVAASHFTC
jgi:hypothetical protein